MIVPKIAICPICEKRTYMRIEDGSYMYEYPIRVYCYNCHALIKGIYVMDESVGPKGLHLYNARQVECLPNQGAEREINADYLAEISGELPCKKIRVFDGKICKSTPYLDATDEIVDMSKRIQELRTFYANMKEWEEWRSIAFQLLNDDEIGFVGSALRNKMGKYDYICSDYLKSLHCLQEVMHHETQFLFVDAPQDSIVSNIISKLSSINQDNLHELIVRIGGIPALKAGYKKLIGVFSMFMEIYPNLLPAETYLQYVHKDDETLGIATCAFTDVKSFYLDAYEALLSLMHIVIALDNILVRGDYLNYHESYAAFYTKSPKTKERYFNKYMSDGYDRYNALDNGKKAELLNQGDPMQAIIQMPADRYLRNAISHNTYKYDGLAQLITVFDQRQPSKVNVELSLLNVAVDCLKLSRSTVILSEILLYLLRFEDHEYHSAIHPRFYGNPCRNDKCPCGSNKKYKNYCIQDVQGMLSSH